jgi:hypothetical protein
MHINCLRFLRTHTFVISYVIYNHTGFDLFLKSYNSKQIISFFLFIYSHVHTSFGSFLHPAPLPHISPFPSSVSGRSCSACPCEWICWRKDISIIRKTKCFLLVELRIAIQKDSYYCSHVPMCYDPCWFNSNWSLHWFLISC